MDVLLHLDHLLFEWINGLGNPITDQIMMAFRNKQFWVPFYILGVFFLYRKFGFRLIGLLAFTGLTIAFADLISSELIKKWVMRLRPCNEPGFKESVDLLVHCGSGYSFTSSHATNHFALASFLFFTLKDHYSKLWLLFIWAGLIAFAQVYVGVHFPIDVVCGGILGCLIGFAIQFIYSKMKFSITT